MLGKRMTINGSKDDTRRFSLSRAGTFTRSERIAILVVVASIALIDIIGFVTTPNAEFAHTALSLAITLSFALYIWSPIIATLVLGGVVTISLFTDSASAGLMAAAIAAGIVLRLTTTPHIFGYIGGLLLANALFAYRYGMAESTPTSIMFVLIIATIAGAIGLALRLAYARGQRLEIQLELQAEREREAVLAERRWIAGELHDSIAHYLTVIAMHAQLVDDEASRPTSQSAIQTSARKALSDLRFVIQMAEEAPRGTGVPSGDLTMAVNEAREEFEATGRTVECTGNLNDERIPRGAEIIFARIVRESATNILKYGGQGEVRVQLNLDPKSIELVIQSPLPETPRRELPSTGTGLNRMAERIMGVNGSFSAGPNGGEWIVSARLPLA
ncbi:MAG: sensor histidine kinase [Leucobacter sp.]